MLVSAESPSLCAVKACSLSFVLQIHPPLERVFHLIPENAVLSGDDFVPGILEPQPDGLHIKQFIATILSRVEFYNPGLYTVKTDMPCSHLTQD